MKALLLLVALALGGCTGIGPSDPPGASSPPVGGSSRGRPFPDTSNAQMYAYTARDTGGHALVEGILTFTRIDTAGAEGTWSFRATGYPGSPGPQVGTGSFVGSLRGALLMLSLNPRNADNNVYLSGTIVRGVYAGRWDWSSFIGPTGNGTFRAVPIRAANSR